MDIDGGGGNRNQNKIRSANEIFQQQPFDSGRSIDNQGLGVLGNPRFNAAQGRRAFRRCGVGTMNVFSVRRAQPKPLQARSLRIAVHDGSPAFLAGVVTGKISRHGGFSRTTL